MFNMSKPTRVIASVAFLGFTGLIFVGAFVIDNGVRLNIVKLTRTYSLVVRLYVSVSCASRRF